MNKAHRVAVVTAMVIVAWWLSPPPSPSAAPHDGSGGQAADVARGTQVFQRAQLLNIDSGTASAARAKAGDTTSADRAILPSLSQQPLPKLTFDGTQLSQLNSLIATAAPAHITVASRTLQADTALTISGQNVTVDFAGAAIEAGAQPPVWLIRLVHARNVAVTNARITGGTNGFLVDSGSNIAIDGNDLGGLSENGIVVTGPSSSLDIHANHLHDLGRAGVMLDGPVRTALVDGNQIDHLLGPSNWNAGIVLTSRGGDIGADPDTFFLPDHYWVVRQPLVQRLQNPTQNVIMANTISDGLSSGIYTDGAVANVFLDNRLDGNSKEGICFDNGATANVFSGNHVAGNGNRWAQSDADLALDFVADAGRAADGTSMAKLPGISIDNAIYNDISGNDVTGNFGGGVKLVRTGLFNTIRNNVIVDNNLGESGAFHFFGVELGAAAPDPAVADLDFVPSSGNIISGNTIHGRHYSGIYVGAGSVQNDLSGNDIAGVEVAPVESAST
ncbi:MAG TPA: right-handed parallel beta-helix repeat-containing protein [Mycobacterium sp.]|uniref:right-handed parallel beta-helix repeat-containing protein n=1 Tax=Mycobacterium sp. TaxID=1785 RepID=UPI002C5CB6C3|nr:right-handed parallel beta-helix repeat-containing protein [Mycobacterium sp.]HME80279.1 right-handed parallel beta-helix repeat-containing protein [Mycobacterium sp.]